MSSLFSHVFIPLAILFIFSNRLRLDPRNIVVLSLFGVLPDADIFLLHRESFHNILIFAIPFLIFIFTRYKREISGIISFYIASHLILDIFNGGIFLLYPYYKNVFFANIEILFNDSFIRLVYDYGISNNIIDKVDPMISSENFGIIAMIIFMSIMVSMGKHKLQELKLKIDKSISRDNKNNRKPYFCIVVILLYKVYIYCCI